MNRVSLNVGIVALESDANDCQVVDVVEIFSNRFCCVSGSTIDDNQVSCCSSCNLVCDMTRKSELSVCPADVDLHEMSMNLAT